ncbi:MAG: hypothetical protein R6U44_05470 [Archaeoglobaceae archaeon]
MENWEEVFNKYDEETINEVIEAYRDYLKEEGYRITTKHGVCSQCMDTCNTFFVLCKKCYDKYQKQMASGLDE